MAVELPRLKAELEAVITNETPLQAAYDRAYMEWNELYQRIDSAIQDTRRSLREAEGRDEQELILTNNIYVEQNHPLLEPLAQVVDECMTQITAHRITKATLERRISFLERSERLIT